MEVPQARKLKWGPRLSCRRQSTITDVVTHPSFSKFIDKSASIRLVDDLFTATKRAKMANRLEPTHPVHEPWKELGKDYTFKWTLQRQDTYNEAGGLGGTNGPAQKMKDGARTDDLAEMLMIAFPLRVLKYIIDRTNAIKIGLEGNATPKPILKQIFLCPGEDPPPNARNHFIPTERNRHLECTVNFLIAWFGVLILCGAYFSGDSNHRIKALYTYGHYGMTIPIALNAMPLSLFHFIRSHLHFSDASQQAPKGSKDYDPLFKVRYIIDELMKSMRSCWIAGDRVAVNESMI